MRIALVSETWSPDINGVAHTLKQISNELRNRGHALQLIRPRPADGSHARADGMQAELQVRGISAPRYREVRFGMPGTRAISRLWREQRPDVIYLATQGPLGWSAQRAAHRLSIPVVGGWHTNFDHYCADYGLTWLTPLVRQRLRTFHNRCAATLVPTHQQANSLSDQGIDHLRVMARGIDGECFSPEKRDPALRQRWGVGAHEPVALHVGRLAPEKNLDQLRETFQTMLAARPDLRLIIVGDGPGRQALQKALPEAHFTGFINPQSLTRHYASADIFVFPSLSETWGNVVLEAMASGLAVVAYRHAAGDELIDNDVNGVSLATDDAEGFREAAAQLCLEPARYARLGRAARTRALSYRWSAITDDFLATLEFARESRHETTSPYHV
ncbi:glycosyltransferase family 4 protein [Halomonas korlensis]|uniref:Glycosyltransferase involved in cell wall bisynthesis n=1 Tax=Halomonas korlensis TaxID=463301 RepID=A0A1I7F042_9GAMM|nr:glycosyltransferase family 1 protein [Halomonas korlensis]SFU29535.1 Glycosyltransferase involved in cell wall bisynthesis [Halomonas korlensis]